MYRIRSHTGDVIEIPANAQEDQAYFKSMNAEAIEYYHQNGYVVLRTLLPIEATSAARTTWATEIKPSKNFIYRQTTSLPEKNRLNEQGYVENPILNVQSVRSKTFGKFRHAALSCIAHTRVREAISALLGDDLKIVQSMYFEGNTSTAPHQDTFYLDSEQVGEMCAVWFALEDIAPNAGRFFVAPGSHKVDIKAHGGDFDVAGDSDRYAELILKLLKDLDLKIVAPALQEGDALVWNSRTIHGALASPNAISSRQSLTAHYIPRRSRFLQQQSRIKPLTFLEFNGIQVALIKDQESLVNRSILWTEARLPFLLKPLRKFIIRQMAKRA